MRKIPFTLVAVATVCLTVVSCSREPKPGKKGGYLVSNKKLIEVPAVPVETAFTPEGFALNYFNGEPAGILRSGDYLILYGDYKPTALTPFRRASGYFEQDSAKPSATDAMTVGPMKGEDEMFKCQLVKPVPPGVYLLECQAGSATVGFPFRVE
ncbi:MAG: hypothetical protein A2Y78_01135 [Acidobacteria bacterium RBG_13_68_16]|jgi:hypothetical protein|nr:MAG: hypothetical protein A2Y78_01135 [Acidobacteria bacterium RBG_13_68_16]